MKLVETRRIDTSKVRAMCIEHDYYTNGDVIAYEQMFQKCGLGMTFRQFYESLRRTTSSDCWADNIVGNIMDELECWDWDAIVPERYIKIHLGDI